jgi:ketosteroid isomerase-like protein
MSEADIEFVRRAVEAFGRNDREATWAMWAQDATADSPKEWPETGVSNGIEEIRAVFDGFDEAFGPDWPLDLDLVRFVDAGDGRVLVEYIWHASGASSGAAVDQEIACVYTVADGKVRHGAFFTSHAGGRKEAGIG